MPFDTRSFLHSEIQPQIKVSTKSKESRESKRRNKHYQLASINITFRFKYFVATNYNMKNKKK
jgi:hypothetical protein